MLDVSSEIKNLYASTSQPKHLIIYFPSIDYTVPDEKIKFESMTLDESICEDDDITFVGCISSKFTIVLYNISEDLNGLKIQVSMKIGDTDTAIPLFNGWVSDVQLETNRAYKDITAYDAIYTKLSEDVADWYNDISFPITLGTLRTSLFTYLELYKFIYIPVVETTLPNDDLEITRGYVPDTLSAIDVIKSICQINGVFGIINREGKFEYRSINMDVVETFGTNYKEATYQEYAVTPAGKVLIRENSSKTGIGYPVSATDTKYIIQSNIFMSNFANDTVTKREVAKNVFENIYSVIYRPFDATNYGAPWLECGDTVSYTMYDFQASAEQHEDIWVTASYTILKRHLSGIQNLFDEFSADGNESTTSFISDLGLDWTVESEIESAASSATDNTVSFYTYLNGGPWTVSAGSEELIPYIFYRNAKGSFVVMHAEIELDMNGNTDIDVYYRNRARHDLATDIIDNAYVIPTRTIVGNVMHLDYFFTTTVTSRSAKFDIVIKNNNATDIIVHTSRVYLMVKGNPATLKNIEVTQEPDKVEYARNEPLDFTGLVVTATYSDGSTEDITDVCSYDPHEGSPAELDWNSVNIYLYDNNKTYSTSFNISVTEADSPLISGSDINSILSTFR